MNSLQTGEILFGGRYRIVRTLGQGGFGITYEAEQVALGRKVAVKEFFMKDCCERDAETSVVSVPTQSNRDLVEKFKAKFIREARMIASLDHPNIVRVIDVFEENGTAYYVMENLPGGSLAEKVKQQVRLPEEEALRYIREVSSALSYIHGRNLVHLDVKPSNILLNAKGDAVLIDFGISKHYDESGSQTSSTPVGISKGYAPLEQSRDGDVSQFTPATDIYSLGATLYNLVTGLVPPEASIVTEDGLSRPAGISDEAWRAIERAMQPRRKDRPQSVASFLSLLKSPSVPAPAASAGPEEISGSEETVVRDPQPAKRGNIESTSGAVDMGLSVEWASCNLGASRPEDYGDYYAWGETSAKSRFFPPLFRYKYSGKSPTDAAHVKLGGKWRMPTKAEFEDLINNCTMTWTILNGISGQKFVSKINGNGIFLPAAGSWNGVSLYNAGSGGYYWSSSLDTKRSYAWGLGFYASSLFSSLLICMSRYPRYLGRPIRPVSDR